MSANLWKIAQFAMILVFTFCIFWSIVIECLVESIEVNVQLSPSHESRLAKLQRKFHSKPVDDYNYYDEENGDVNVGDGDYTNNHTDYEDDDLDFYQSQGINFSKVVVGVVSCRNGTSSNYLEQTSLLIKSVLISAELYNVTRLDFHLFLEHMEDENFLLGRLEEMGYPSGYEQVDMNLIVHSAIQIIPVRYRRNMVFQKRYRCAYTRFFFPKALPRVDAILYLGTDMLVTGNILDFWKFFKDMKGEQQMIAGTRNTIGPDSSRKSRKFLEEEEEGDVGIERVAVSIDTPQPPPKGINAGVLLMNLTRMRTYGWEEKFLRAFQDYSKLSGKGGSGGMTSQKVMNILLFYNPGLFLPLPCHYNFGSSHCTGKDSGVEGEPTCLRAAEDDDNGIQLIHVNAPYNFETGKVTTFQPLLRYFHQYNMSKKAKEWEVDRMTKELMIPIRTSYDRRSKVSKCHGKLNKLLFSNFFVD